MQSQGSNFNVAYENPGRSLCLINMLPKNIFISFFFWTSERPLAVFYVFTWSRITKFGLLVHDLFGKDFTRVKFIDLPLFMSSN